MCVCSIYTIYIFIQPELLFTYIPDKYIYIICTYIYILCTYIYYIYNIYTVYIIDIYCIYIYYRDPIKSHYIPWYSHSTTIDVSMVFPMVFLWLSYGLWTPPRPNSASPEPRFKWEDASRKTGTSWMGNVYVWIYIYAVYIYMHTVYDGNIMEIYFTECIVTVW